MKIDIDYLKIVLDRFIESETQYIETSSFDKIRENENENFFFHWDILLDKKLIVNSQGNLGKFYFRTNNNLMIKHKNVRLNDEGYAFYEALKDIEFRSKIKKDFKDCGIETLILASKRFLENKIDNFL